MNTTIFTAPAATRMQVLEVVVKKLNTPTRPVCCFLSDEKSGEMVVSGCSTTAFLSALRGRTASRITITKCSK